MGIKFSKTYRFTDINYKVASRNDKETMFLAYSELLNSLDCAATTKLTICNRRQSQADFEQSVLMPMQEDGLDKYRREYNQNAHGQGNRGQRHHPGEVCHHHGLQAGY